MPPNPFDSPLWTDEDLAYLHDNGDRFSITENNPGKLIITAMGYDIFDALDDYFSEILDLEDLYTTIDTDDSNPRTFHFTGLAPDVQGMIVTEIEKLKAAKTNEALR